ncbi:MAG: hypothetical protein IK015_04595 [Treponema sp.]|nr:hypothetical protein [Treponema sp.]
MKAKDVSLWAIVIAIVWVGLLVLAKGFVPVIWSGKALGLTVQEIMLSGGFFVVVCTPVYRSIWLDKKLGVSSGETKGESDGTKAEGGNE